MMKYVHHMICSCTSILLIIKKKKNHKNDFSILFLHSLNPPQNKSFHPTKSEQKETPFFDTNYRSQSQIENIPPHPSTTKYLISMHMYCIHDPIQSEFVQKQRKTDRQHSLLHMTPHFYDFYDNILNIWPHLKWIVQKQRKTDRQYSQWL